jgi:hypothetical protein
MTLSVFGASMRAHHLATGHDDRMNDTHGDKKRRALTRLTWVIFVVGLLASAAGFALYFGVISVTETGKDPSVTALVGGGRSGNVVQVGEYTLSADAPRFSNTLPKEAAEACNNKEATVVTEKLLPIHLSPTGAWLCLTENQKVELDSDKVTVVLNEINAKQPPDQTPDAPPLSSLTITTKKATADKLAAALPALLLAIGPAAFTSSMFVLMETARARRIP